mmetsp:Transcript_22768/g.45565  ORF Transcript_22768/g.45565 Transcript_22768/m.45565 type:complete len:276 (+) Transcript_22768:172-999(+)
MDVTCLLTVVFRLTSDVLRIVQFAKRMNSNNIAFSQENMYALNPTYLQSQWESRSFALDTTAAIFSALSWLFLCIPILQISWFLSGGGKRGIASFTMVVVLAVTGSLCELISSLMVVGANSALNWISTDFELEEWDLVNNQPDGTGWKVLEMIRLCMTGMLLWIDAFEWICLFGILTLLAIKVRSENKNVQEGSAVFGNKWAALGLAIGLFSIFEFITEIMRMWNWQLFASVSKIISAINLIILLPIWLIVLGRQLPIARAAFEGIKTLEDSLEV